MQKQQQLTSAERIYLLVAMMSVFENAYAQTDGVWPGELAVLAQYNDSADAEILELVRDFSPDPIHRQFAESR